MIQLGCPVSCHGALSCWGVMNRTPNFPTDRFLLIVMGSFVFLKYLSLFRDVGGVTHTYLTSL